MPTSAACTVKVLHVVHPRQPLMLAQHRPPGSVADTCCHGALPMTVMIQAGWGWQLSLVFACWEAIGVVHQCSQQQLNLQAGLKGFVPQSMQVAGSLVMGTESEAISCCGKATGRSTRHGG